MATDTIISDIQLATPSSAVDVPSELSNYFQAVYSSLHTLQQAFVTYCGAGSLGIAQGKSVPSYSQCFPQGMTKMWLQAGVAFTPGQLFGLTVDNSINASSQVVAILADCTTSVNAAGIYHGSTALAKGDWGEFWFFRASVTKIGGLVAGTRYYLASGGQITSTPVTTAGYLSQYVGQAISSSHLMMDLGSARKNTVGNTTSTFLQTF